MSEEKFFNKLKSFSHQVANRTRDAYSFDNFGFDEWLKIAFYLENDCNLNENQVEWMLRSKHMRWSIDGQFGSRTGRMFGPSLETFQRYIDKDPTVLDDESMIFL